MDRFIDIVKRYPLWIAGGVVAVILLIWFSSGSSSSSGPVIVSTGPSEATIQANAMIEATRLENQRAGAAGVVAQELAKINADSYALALATSRDIREIDAEAAVSLANVNKDMQTSLATIVTGATTNQTQIIADTTKSLAEIDKAKSTQLAELSAQIERERTAGLNAAAMASANAAVTIEQIRANASAAELERKLTLSSESYFQFNPANMASLFGLPQPDNINIQVGAPGYAGWISDR